jgi:hypothetical protein
MDRDLGAFLDCSLRWAISCKKCVRLKIRKGNILPQHCQLLRNCQLSTYDGKSMPRHRLPLTDIDLRFIGDLMESKPLFCPVHL